MELNAITISLGILLVFFLVRLMVRQWLVSKMLRQSYQQKLHRVLSDPESRPKGRFE